MPDLDQPAASDDRETPDAVGSAEAAERPEDDGPAFGSAEWLLAQLSGDRKPAAAPRSPLLPPAQEEQPAAPATAPSTTPSAASQPVVPPATPTVALPVAPAPARGRGSGTRSGGARRGRGWTRAPCR
ncbi:hypothetical protein [Microterricola pindariensis]|uniref:hypothetical protein n=1 Tax=Microterricola pindariensis TaxID=478010 RepID=UPI0013966A65|nr:hypothetical protein [Microterricola pindariensis]